MLHILATLVTICFSRSMCGMVDLWIYLRFINILRQYCRSVHSDPENMHGKVVDKKELTFRKNNCIHNTIGMGLLKILIN